MHVMLVTQGVPNAHTAGGALTAWSLMIGLLEKGVRVSVCALLVPNDPYKDKQYLYTEECKKHGAEIFVLSENIIKNNKINSLSKILNRTFNLKVQDVYKHANCLSEVQRYIDELKPDVLLSYHFEGLAAIYKIKNVPKLALVGDPTHLPIFHNWRAREFSFSGSYLKATIAAFFALFQHPKCMIEMLNSCEACGAFAAHHAEWFRHNGAKKCEYYQTPMPDIIGQNWRQRRDQYKKKDKYKILMVGHLRGTATRLGVELFAKGILPVLEKTLPKDSFEVHIVGAFSEMLPLKIKNLLNNPSIKIRGYVDSIEEEFLSSDILLVPTLVKLGIRVRIITGFSFGCCIVAHEANALGIPEMRHGKNALLGKDGNTMAKVIITALNNDNLRHSLENASRDTFKNFFITSAAIQKVIDKLDKLANERKN